MISNTTHLAEINSPNQKIQASVELYKGSTLQTTCTCADVLSEFSVGRVGEGKFFGYGIVHSLKVILIDMDKTISTNSINRVRVSYTVNDNKVYPYPTFDIKPEGIERDETTNTITITAYDSLGAAAEHTFSELNLTPPYTYAQVATACRSLLGLGTLSTTGTEFNTSFAEGANFDGSEKIRDVLNAIAEATQTIYYVKAYGVSGTLRFKRISRTAAADYSIGKDKYFSLKSNGAVVISNVCHATELGDNVATTSTTSGITQYVRNNPFWETIAESGDISATVEAAATKMRGVSIAQFESEWAGNYLLEPLDKITMELEDGSLITSFVMDDVIRYDGTLMETTRWQYDVNDTETASNPSSLGEVLNQTYARVDKANKQIEMLVSDTTDNTTKIAQILLDLDSINLTVKEQGETIETLEGFDVSELEGTVATHTQQISGIQIDINGIKNTVSSQTDKITTLEGTATELSAAVGENGEKISGLETDTGTLKKTTEEHTTKIGTLETTLDSITAKVENQESKITTLEGTAEDINAAIAESGEKITGLETTAGQLTTTITEQATKIGTLETTVDDISGTVSNQGSKITTLETENGQIKSTTEEHTEQIGQLQITTNAITQTVSSQEGKITTLQGTTQEISGALAETNGKVSGLEEDAEELRGDIDGLEEETGNLKLTTTENTTKIGTLETTLDSITARVENQESKVTTLEGAAEDINAAIGESNGKISGLETETGNLKATTEEHTKQIGTLETTATRIDATVSEQNTKITTLETAEGELRGTTETHTSQIGALQINTGYISASVTKVEESTNKVLDGINDELTKLSKEVNTKITTDEITAEFVTSLGVGANSITTSTTRYTFNDEGLTVSKSDSEISTQITEDGMTITRNGEEVLVADNEGVKAEDLHATTYLIIGSNSRIEDWGDRTACFWIGG